MAVVSISIGAMQALVTALTNAVRDLSDDAATLQGKLSHVGLSCSALQRWTATGSRIYQLDQLRQECQRRLDIARQVAAQSVSSSYGPYRH